MPRELCIILSYSEAAAWPQYLCPSVGCRTGFQFICLSDPRCSENYRNSYPDNEKRWRL